MKVETTFWKQVENANYVPLKAVSAAKTKTHALNVIGKWNTSCRRMGSVDNRIISHQLSLVSCVPFLLCLL